MIDNTVIFIAQIVILPLITAIYLELRQLHKNYLDILERLAKVETHIKILEKHL